MNRIKRVNTLGGLLLTLVLGIVTGCSSAPSLAQDGPSQASINRGQETYDLWCGTCHAAGEGYAGTQMLTLTRAEGLGVMKDNDTLTDAYIELVVRKGLGMMPVFRKTEITDAQLNDLLAYLGSDE